MDTIEQAPAAGAIRVEPSPDRTVIAFVGEIDGALRTQASTSMGLALISGKPIVVDSSAATFIDSSGLAFVLQLHLAATEAGIPLTLRDPQRVLRDVLEMVGLSGELHDEPDDVPVG